MFKAALETVQSAVAQGDIRCAAAAIFHHSPDSGRMQAFGETAAGVAATVATRFDLASLTKIIVTTTLLLRLEQQGKLMLDWPLSRWYAAFARGERKRVSVLDLALHRGGLPAVYDFTRSASSMAQAAAHIGGIPLACEPRTRVLYSDLGFILLGDILQKESGMALEVLAKREIFDPLGMPNTSYCPTGGQIAPTEFDPVLGRCLCGVVHDENARAFGGVSGHAGLFSDVTDLAAFSYAMLHGTARTHAAYLGAPQMERIRTLQTAGLAGQGRAFGWMMNQPAACELNERENPAGRGWSPASYGHTGFTGTSIWIEPERKLVCVLLTNRVCPTRENPSIFALRRAFHTAALQG